MKKKIVTLSMRDQMYEALKDLIVKNSYAPNTVLQIDRLAEEFGVSATPVREALVRLESDGLVALIPNKGAIVTDIQPEDVRNTWEMRRLLEPYAARLSAHLLDKKEIDQLRSMISQLRDGPFDDTLYIESDTRLHELLYTHLANGLLKDSIRRINQMSIRIRYFPEGSSSMHENVVNEVIKEHLAILDAAEAKDSERLAALVYGHLVNGEQRTLAAVSGKKS